MTASIERIRAETERFRASLPALLKDIPGRWVIFKDGAVQADFLTEQEAYNEAIARFGAEGGFVVMRVEDEEPRVLSPLYIYRIA